MEKKTKDAESAIPARGNSTKSAPKKKKKVAKPKVLKTRGRKPWAPDYQFIEDQSRNGLNDKQIAALTGISFQGFCSKKSELTELTAALERGRAKGVSMASTALWKLIAGGDRQAAQFYLERKGGWKDEPAQNNVTIQTTAGETKVTLGQLYKQIGSDE